jgi:hypothetical protein
MTVDRKGPPTELFWELAEPFLARDGVAAGKLMGFPCLRIEGGFFCTCDPRTGELIVKLPKARVAELVASGSGQPFAPAGRVFSEWVLIDHRDEQTWIELMSEALAFVGGDRAEA